MLTQGPPSPSSEDGGGEQQSDLVKLREGWVPGAAADSLIHNILPMEKPGHWRPGGRSRVWKGRLGKL